MNPTLHRTNLNLHASDVAFLQHTYGYGWTEQARELLHQRVEQLRQQRQQTLRGHIDETNDIISKLPFKDTP